MGWTIDVPPTPAAEFGVALDAAPVVAWPQGDLSIWDHTEDAAGRIEEWHSPTERSPGRLRPEVLEQIAAAKAEALKQAAELGEPAVSASLHGHVHHAKLHELRCMDKETEEADQAELAAYEETHGPHVVVQGHSQEILDQRTAVAA